MTLIISQPPNKCLLKGSTPFCVWAYKEFVFDNGLYSKPRHFKFEWEKNQLGLISKPNNHRQFFYIAVKDHSGGLLYSQGYQAELGYHCLFFDMDETKRKNCIQNKIYPSIRAFDGSKKSIFLPVIMDIQYIQAVGNHLIVEKFVVPNTETFHNFGEITGETIDEELSEIYDNFFNKLKMPTS